MLNQSLSKKRKGFEVLMKALMLLSVGLTAALVLFLLAYVLVQGVPNMPDSLFQSVRFLTTAVSSEMAYSSGLQRQALFSIALVLFLFIMLINAALNFFLKREKE